MVAIGQPFKAAGRSVPPTGRVDTDLGAKGPTLVIVAVELCEL